MRAVGNFVAMSSAAMAMFVMGAKAYELPPCVVPLNCSMQMKTDTFNEATLREVRDLGFRMVRRGLYWNAVEKEKGKYDFSSVDRQMKLCKDLGLTVIITLFSGNDLYENDGLGGIQTEEGRKGFAAFAVAAAKHFADQSVMFEIWNEPNVRTFWRKNGTHNSPEFAKEYSDLVNEVAPAMVKAVPGVFVMAGSVSNYWEPSYRWTEECFKNGVLKSGIRAWSVHPYGVKTPEEFKVGHDIMKSLLKKYGAPADFPLIDSERGFTATKREEGYSGGDEANILNYQAWYLVRQYLNDMIEGVRVTSWYEYKGNEGFSLFENGKPRPAFDAAKTMIAELGGYHFVKLVKTESDRDRIAIFVNDKGERKLVAWTSAAPGGSPDETKEHVVVLRLGAKDAEAVNMLGKASKLHNGIAIDLTGAPQYIALAPDANPIDAVNIGKFSYPVMPGSSQGASGAAAAIPVSAGPLALCSGESGWKFIPNTGKGAVSVGKSADGKDSVFIDWDFSQSKSKSTPYVMTTVPLSVEGAGAIVFLAKSPIAQGLTMRVADSTGQTLQSRARIKGTGGWEMITFPLNKKLEHWDGANDGFVHFPLKSLCVNVPKPGDNVKGRVELADFATTAGTGAAATAAKPAAVKKSQTANVKPPKVEPLANAVPLKFFEQGAEWNFVKNTGTGGVELKEADGRKCAAVTWDFSKSKAKGVPYVLAFVPADIAGGQAITMAAKSEANQKLTFRVVDSTGQTLQFKTKIAAGDWQTVKIPLNKKLEHWDGANDGFTHFPVKSIAISIPKPADAVSGVTYFSDASVK